MKLGLDWIKGELFKCHGCGFVLNKDDELREEMLTQLKENYEFTVNCPECGAEYREDDTVM